jgi:hypothetical protein
VADPISGTSSDSNPYRPPQATLADVHPTLVLRELAESPQRMPAGRGASWWGEAWRLFKGAPGIWIVILVIFVVISMGLSLLPFVGLAGNLLFPIFIGGIMLGCRALDEGGALEVAHLFAGFKEHAGSLALVGVASLVGIFIAMAVAALFMLGGIGGIRVFMGGAGDVVSALGPTAVLLAVLVYMALIVPLMMVLWFAPPLVVFHRMAPLEAMKRSFAGCLKNMLPFLIYGLVGFLLAIVATIPIGLGWLVVGPMVFASIYASYKEIFLKHA